uniref:Uncharacterized protein n=1 Tax=Arundo donax TaxID=35708 RepID=A0A0A9F6P9_ARUDO
MTLTGTTSVLVRNHDLVLPIQCNFVCLNMH